MSEPADNFRDWLPRRADLPGVLLVAAAFWGLGHAGFSLTSLARPEALRISLSAGFAIAAYLIWGYRFWAGMFLGATAAALESGASLSFALGMGVVGAFPGLLGAYLMREWAGFQNSLERLRDVFALLLFGVLVARLVATGIATANLWLAGALRGDQWLAIYFNRAIGGGVGVLIATPFLLAFSEPVKRPRGAAYYVEAAAIMLITTMVGGLVFSPAFLFPHRYPLAFLLLPLIVWAALRYEARGATTVTLLLAGVSVLGTTGGHGPFGLLPADESTLLLALFIGVVAITGLLVAASSAERKQIATLREGMALLRQVLQLLPVGVWIADREGRVTSANPAAERIWRAGTANAYQGWGARKKRSIEMHDWLLSRATGAAVTTAEEKIEVPAADGSSRMLLSSAMPLLDSRGQQIGAIAVHRDVTEMILAEQSIRELAAVVEQTDDIVYVTDRGGFIEYANPGFEKHTGYTREEAVGRTPGMLRSGQYDRSFYANLWTTILAGKSFQDVLVNRKKSGELYYEAKTISSIRNTEGEITHFVSTGKDITERVLAEAEQKRLLEVLEASLNEIYIFAPDTLRFRYVNRAALGNLGYSAEAMRTLTPLDLKPELDAVSFRGLIAPLLNRERDQTVFQTVHRRVDGSLYPVEVHLQMAGPETERVLLAVIFDITARKQAEDALRDFAEQLRLLSRRLSETQESERAALARELHDRVGQNVTALTLNLNMLSGELPADTRQKLQARLEDCESLLDSTSQLIRDLMVELRPPGLDELGLAAALTEYARRVAARSGFSTTVRGPEATPRLPPAVEITLFRIAQEALTNVAKHARATEVTLALEAGPDTVMLTIADNGRGFDPAARPERPSASLGMVSMRERAEAIGGKLRVESAPDQGARVIVEAPRAAPGVQSR